MSAPLLRVEDIHKRYGSEEVLRGVSFEVDRGQTKVFIGPSGTGKSTLLRCVNQLTPPDKGRVFLEGAEVTHHKADINRLRASIGFVFQDFNLFAHLTALQNVAIGPTRVKRVRKEQAQARALAELERVGLGDKANAYPAQLSGGQQQRVAIARALVNDPVIIFADEATGNLDSRTSYEIMVLIQELNEKGKTIVFVTHEPDIAAFSKRTITLKDGKVVSDKVNTDIRSARAVLEKLPPVI
jgi:polar amino acid transport system ATP-binding protein